MSSFPDSPTVLKGAIISVGISNPVPTIIAFQYNPDTLTRVLEPRTVKGQDGAGRAEAMRLAGAPKETLSCSIELDGTEDSPLGVAPALSTLELLLYPPSAVTIAKAVLALTGVITVIDPPAPMTLFGFGPYRVVPVRLTSLTVTEEAFNPQLTPIRAKVDLKMDVLTTYDLPTGSIGYALALAHQVAGIEALGRLNTFASLRDRPGSKPGNTIVGRPSLAVLAASDGQGRPSHQRVTRWRALMNQAARPRRVAQPVRQP